MEFLSSVRLLLGRYGPLALIGLVGLGLSIGTAYMVHEQAQQKKQEAAKIAFLRHVNETETHLRRRLDRNLSEVYALRDFFHAVPNVSPERFRTFLERSVSTNAALQAMTWSERVTNDERAAFRQRVRANGFPGFSITGTEGDPLPPDHRDVYYPVTYIHPYSGNEAALGFDSYDRPSERRAIQAALARDTLTASGRIRLVQEVENQYGFVAYMPVYDQTRTASASRSAAAVRGVVIGVYRVPDLVGVSMQAANHGFDALLYDASAPEGQRYLGHYRAEAGAVQLGAEERDALARQFRSECPDPSLCTVSVDVAQRTWRLQLVPPVGFFQPGGIPRSIYVFIIGVLLTAGFIGFTFVRQRHLEEVQALAHELREEKETSDRLLLNILPEPVAQELKEEGTATPVYHDGVSVLFADFVGFTPRAETLPPEVLIDTLDRLFSAFDRIAEAHGLEKIKTIGDAYMVAGGVPTSSDTHAVDCVRAGLDMIRFVEVFNERLAADDDASMCWEMRVGVSSGPLVAGVLGTSKFAYDVFGDTVVTASRMEACSEPGRLNVSGATHARIANRFVCEPRGKVDAKGKGSIDMYFVIEEVGESASPLPTVDELPSAHRERLRTASSP
jgi:class 3 adenylate cyclase/CHASE1-domain containing sensor protein